MEQRLAPEVRKQMSGPIVQTNGGYYAAFGRVLGFFLSLNSVWSTVFLYQFPETIAFVGTDFLGHLIVGCLGYNCSLWLYNPVQKNAQLICNSPFAHHDEVLFACRIGRGYVVAYIHGGIYWVVGGENHRCLHRSSQNGQNMLSTDLMSSLGSNGFVFMEESGCEDPRLYYTHWKNGNSNVQTLKYDVNLFGKEPTHVLTYREDFVLIRTHSCVFCYLMDDGLHYMGKLNGSLGDEHKLSYVVRVKDMYTSIPLEHCSVNPDDTDRIERTQLVSFKTNYRRSDEHAVYTNNILPLDVQSIVCEYAGPCVQSRHCPRCLKTVSSLKIVRVLDSKILDIQINGVPCECHEIMLIRL